MWVWVSHGGFDLEQAVEVEWTEWTVFSTPHPFSSPSTSARYDIMDSFLLLAKSQKGAAAAKVIADVTAAVSLFTFDLAWIVELMPERCLRLLRAARLAEHRSAEG